MPGTESKTEAATAFVRELTTIRCAQCGRTVCKATKDAVRAGEVIEIKCSRCNQRNYLMGAIDV